MTELDPSIDEEIQVDTNIDLDVDTWEAEITIDDYNKLKDSNERWAKNWIEPTKALLKEYWVKTIDELKSKLKEPKQESFVTREDLEIRDFISSNPDMKGYENDLRDYLSKWISHEEAKILIERKDKTIENRKKLETMNVSNSELWGTSLKSKYTKEELGKLDSVTYNKVAKKIKSWDISVS